MWNGGTGRGCMEGMRGVLGDVGSYGVGGSIIKCCIRDAGDMDGSWNGK
jgi:hypothetical protein